MTREPQCANTLVNCFDKRGHACKRALVTRDCERQEALSGGSGELLPLHGFRARDSACAVTFPRERFVALVSALSLQNFF